MRWSFLCLSLSLVWSGDAIPFQQLSEDTKWNKAEEEVRSATTAYMEVIERERPSSAINIQYAVLEYALKVSVMFSVFHFRCKISFSRQACRCL